jgi:hypothetical protein
MPYVIRIHPSGRIDSYTEPPPGAPGEDLAALVLYLTPALAALRTACALWRDLAGDADPARLAARRQGRPE